MSVSDGATTDYENGNYVDILTKVSELTTILSRLVKKIHKLERIARQSKPTPAVYINSVPVE